MIKHLIIIFLLIQPGLGALYLDTPGSGYLNGSDVELYGVDYSYLDRAYVQEITENMNDFLDGTKIKNVTYIRGNEVIVEITKGFKEFNLNNLINNAIKNYEDEQDLEDEEWGRDDEDW